MARFYFTEPVKGMASISDTNDMELGTVSNMSLVDIKHRTICFHTVLAAPSQKLPTSC